VPQGANVEVQPNSQQATSLLDAQAEPDKRLLQVGIERVWPQRQPQPKTSALVVEEEKERLERGQWLRTLSPRESAVESASA